MPLVQKEPVAPAPKKGKKKKGGKVEHAVEEEQKSLVTEEVKKEREIPQFVGNMQIGVAYIMMFMIVGAVLSGDFCWWTKTEVIF